MSSLWVNLASHQNCSTKQYQWVHVGVVKRRVTVDTSRNNYLVESLWYFSCSNWKTKHLKYKPFINIGTEGHSPLLLVLLYQFSDEITEWCSKNASFAMKRSHKATVAHSFQMRLELIPWSFLIQWRISWSRWMTDDSKQFPHSCSRHEAWLSRQKWIKLDEALPITLLLFVSPFTKFILVGDYSWTCFRHRTFTCKSFNYGSFQLRIVEPKHLLHQIE